MDSFKIDTQLFSNVLLRWFNHHGRDLPWRKDYEPYHVWLSEIMLQQTQMDRGVSYFKRWLRRFPTISSVAEAELEEILKYWEGLGYYARARNLHKAARYMVESCHGRLPESYSSLLELPGVGPYTASAIASIAFNQDIAVVDANVERVFARIFDIDKPLKSKGVHARITALANELLPAGKARVFNQALMDLGGVICTPKNPQCGICPVSELCKAYQGNFVEARPIKGLSQPLIHIEMATAILVVNGHIFIQQRFNDDIWGGLWEFPGGRLKGDESPENAVVREYDEETGFPIEICEKVTTVIHFHTKYKVTLHCYRAKLLQMSILPDLQAAQKYHWVGEKQLNNFAFPAGHRKFIEYMRSNCPEALLVNC